MEDGVGVHIWKVKPVQKYLKPAFKKIDGLIFYIINNKYINNK